MNAHSMRATQRLASIAAARHVSPAALQHDCERRREQPARHAVFLLARLFLADYRMANCVIVDLSENGARILLDADLALPQTLKLKTLHDGRFRRARLVWQRGREAGVSFALERRIRFGNLSQRH